MPNHIPDRTLSNSSWLLVGGATIHECLDEGLATPDESATRVYTTTDGANFEIGFAPAVNPNSPVDGSVSLGVRMRHQNLTGTASAQNVTFLVYSAAVLVATIVATYDVVTNSLATYNYPLTAGEIALIEDYSDITVEATATLVSGTVALMTTMELFVSTRTLRAYVIS